MVRDFRHGLVELAVFKLNDRVAIDSHVGVVDVGQKAHYSGFLGDKSVTKLVFEVFAAGLPGTPDEIDAVGDLGHEGFNEAESPVTVFEVSHGTDCVAASVGG